MQSHGKNHYTLFSIFMKNTDYSLAEKTELNKKVKPTVQKKFTKGILPTVKYKLDAVFEVVLNADEPTFTDFACI